MLYLNNKLYTSKLTNYVHFVLFVNMKMKLHYISFTLAIQLADLGDNLNYLWSKIWYFLISYHRLIYLAFLTSQIIKTCVVKSLIDSYSLSSMSITPETIQSYILINY